MHYEQTNNESTSATVANQRHGSTELLTLSARPQITYVKPWYDTYPRLVVGYKNDVIIEGYMFDKVTNVYVSAGGDGVHGGTYGVYDHTSVLSAVSAFSPFSTALSISAKDLLTLYPEFSGFELDNNWWKVESDNVLTLTLSAADKVGNIDLIILNPAGYCLLSKALSGSTINMVA